MWTYNNSDELYHHGILGMKWGIRRYQNPDGSLTNAGKKRANKLSTEYYKLTKKSIKKSNSSNNKSSKKISDLTDEELKKQNNRLELENRNYELQQKYQYNMSQKGKSTANKVMSYIGKNIIKPATTEATKQLTQDILVKLGRTANDSLNTSLRNALDPDSGLKKTNSKLKLQLENHNLQEKLQNKKKETAKKKVEELKNEKANLNKNKNNKNDDTSAVNAKLKANNQEIEKRAKEIQEEINRILKDID